MVTLNLEGGGGSSYFEFSGRRGGVVTLNLEGGGEE